MDNNYFIVKAKCGHVGKHNYILIDFPILASSKKEAASIARCLPRVKHNYKDAIVDVQEVDSETFENQVSENRHNNYLKASNIQQQRKYYSEYYLNRLEETRTEEKCKSKAIPFRLIRQLLAHKEYFPKEYKEMMNAYACKSKRIMQN